MSAENFLGTNRTIALFSRYPNLHQTARRRLLLALSRVEAVADSGHAAPAPVHRGLRVIARRKLAFTAWPLACRLRRGPHREGNHVSPQTLPLGDMPRAGGDASAPAAWLLSQEAPERHSNHATESLSSSSRLAQGERRTLASCCAQEKPLRLFGSLDAFQGGSGISVGISMGKVWASVRISLLSCLEKHCIMQHVFINEA